MQVMRNCSPSRRGQQRWIKTNEGFRIDGPRSKDEDLALFHDLYTRENKNFLYPSTDDIEASLPTKLGGLTGFRISASQTPPWKGNDLLATDAEKNDYDWLLTPPGTPLFPSLDKDSLQTCMDRSVPMQPYSAPKVSSFLGSNTPELDCKFLRKSPGPRTPTSTVSSTSTYSFSRNRAPSPSRANSSPTLRPATPAKTLVKSSTMLNRASTRSSPPLLRRTNTSPTVRSSSTERNTTPMRGRTRGTSVSPKPQAWQPPDLGFSAEPPPNLRTSIERPLSSSRNITSRPRPGTHGEARHSYSEVVDRRQSHLIDSRQSLRHNSSSSASKVSSSTTSQDRWSSRGSVISSSDDGTDVVEPTFLDFSVMSPSSISGTSKTFNGRLENEVSSKCSPMTNRQRRSLTSSSLETSGFSSASARKSLEPSMQRVDHRRISQNMFRPLLSSAPTTSFYNIGQTAVRHRRSNSLVEPSITASSNASSEQGVKIFPGNESSDDGEGEVESEWDKSLPPGFARGKFEANTNNAIHEEYDTLHDHVAHCDQESVADSASCGMDVTVEIEVDTPMHSLDRPAHEADLERNQNDSEAAPGRGTSSELPKSSMKVVNCESNYDDIEDSIIEHVNAKQVFVDVQEDSSILQKGSPLKSCDTGNPSQFYHELDKPELPKYVARPDFHEPFKPELERFHEATCEAMTESNVRFPEGDFITEACLNTEQGPPGRNLDADQPVMECITNTSISGTVTCHEEDSLHPKKTAENKDFSDGRQLQDADLPKNPMQKIWSSAVMDVVSSERPLAIENTFFNSANITEGDSRLRHSEIEENPPPKIPTRTGLGYHHHSSHGHESRDDPSSCSSTPSSQEQEAFLRQPKLASQDSCREYYIDMPEIQENVNTREHKDSTFSTPPRDLSNIENDSTFILEKCLGTNVLDYSQDPSQKHAIDLNEVDERFKQVLSYSDDVQADPLEEEHGGSRDKVLPNEVPSPSQDFHECFDVNKNSSNDVIRNIDMDGSKSLERCVVIEASEEASVGVHELDQIELHGDELSKTFLLSEDLTQSFNEAQPHTTLEFLSMQTDVNEPVLLANNSKAVDEDTCIQMNTVCSTGVQQQPHSTETSLKIRASSGWKPARPSFSLEEATNTILFCSSIVHDMVYKAATVAAEKEAAKIAAAAPLSYQGKGHVSNSDFMKSLRGKVSKSGTWKGRTKESKSFGKAPQGEDSVKVPVTITQHPTPIDGMEKDPVKVEADKAFPDNTKEKSFMGLSVNSNCQCSVM